METELCRHLRSLGNNIVKESKLLAEKKEESAEAGQDNHISGRESVKWRCINPLASPAYTTAHAVLTKNSSVFVICT